MPPSSSSSKQTKTSWTTHDLACTPCREKKIRCGRERPQCGACKKEGLHCGYSTPGKRVNHVKLLCTNFKELEDRLSNIEGKISNVANAIDRKYSDSGDELHSRMSEASETDSVPETKDYAFDSEFRRGSCTLYSLCDEFSDLATSASTSLQNGVHNDTAEAIKTYLSRLCSEASVKDNLELRADPTPIRLPPKQFLWMTQSYFFQHLDSTTDIFVQSNFLANVEAIYSRPFEPKDEVWAICFNMVILLVLSAENPGCGADEFRGTQFVRPFLETIRSALNSAPLLIGAKLVNAQALALLSIAAEKYYPEGVSESLFAQACLIARKISVQQTRAASVSPNAAEEEERRKLVTSLFLRDKTTAITRGSNWWLPGYDSNVSSALGQQNPADSKYAARLALASIQEGILRLSHSAESQRQSSSKHRNAMLRIQRQLQAWEEIHGASFQHLAAPQGVKLKLDYFATRICAFRESCDTNNISRALNDARISCLLFLTAFHVDNQTLTNRLKQILSSQSSNVFMDGIASLNKGQSHQEMWSEKSGENAPHLFLSVLDSFSVPGFFMLLKNIIQPECDGVDNQAADDLYLLQMVNACFKSVNSKDSIDNYNQKVGRLMEKTLDVVRELKKPTLQLPTPPFEIDQPDFPINTQSQALDQSSGQIVPDFFDPGFSFESMAGLLRDTSFPASSPGSCGPSIGPLNDFFTPPLTFNESQHLPTLQDAVDQPKRKRRHLDDSNEILWTDHMMEPCL